MGELIRNKESGWWIGAYVDSSGKRRRHRLHREEREAKKILAALEGKADRKSVV